MAEQPCELCGAPDVLQHRQVKRVDLAPIVEGMLLPTGMLLCQGCREMVDGAGPLLWVEDGFAFCKFSDGVFAKRYNPKNGDMILVNLPDETTYRPGRSSWPPGVRPAFGPES